MFLRRSAHFLTVAPAQYPTNSVNSRLIRNLCDPLHGIHWVSGLAFLAFITAYWVIDCFMPHVHILASICRVKMPMPSPVPLERVCELGTTDTLLHIPYGISWGCSSWNRHTHARVRVHKHTHTHKGRECREEYFCHDYDWFHTKICSS